VQLKLNTTGIIRDNVIVDTKGPSIMVYGALDVGRPSLIERNLVVGSHNSSGIVVGGGPVMVRNNIAVKNAEAGRLKTTATRVARGVVVVHNTVTRTTRGILAPDHGPWGYVEQRGRRTHSHRGSPIPGPALSCRQRDCSGVCFVGPGWGLSSVPALLASPTMVSGRMPGHH
jgi:hypothetical protein